MTDKDCLLESSPGPASAGTASGSESGAPPTKAALGMETGTLSAKMGLGMETGTLSAKPGFDVKARMMFLEMSPSKMALVISAEMAFFEM